jgi:hypothetical protein
MHWQMVVGLSLGIAALAGNFVAAWKLGKDHITLNMLLATLGGVSGFVMGMLLSPYSADKITGIDESKEFFTYGKALSTFISGLVLGKADKLWSDAITGKEPAVQMGRICIFVISFLVLGLFAFVSRRYM